MRIFFDSSVLIAAVGSPTGGSSKIILEYGKHIIVSNFVLNETERTIRKKFYDYHLTRYFSLIESINIAHLNFSPLQEEEVKDIIIEKDRPILFHSKQLNADYLITLDKKDFLENELAKKYFYPGKILSPGEFLQI